MSKDCTLFGCLNSDEMWDADYEKKSMLRKGGQLKGILIIEDNFDDPLPDEVLKSFLD